MQSISLDMEDINTAQDGYLSDEEFPPLADELPPLSPSGNNGDPFGEDNPLGSGGGSDGDKENQGDKKQPRRLIMRKPQPKFDAARLCSDRGLPTLNKHFEQIKFKGKGHELSDLNKLMWTMEHWAHRLFPKMSFDEAIERIEKLGKKKPVQTYIKKIRLDMPLMDEDFVQQEDDPEGNDVVRGGSGEEVEAISQFSGPSEQTSGTPANISVSLSEEQRERMECNKRLAMERRKTKGLAAPPASSQGSITADEIQDLERDHADEEDMEDQMWNDIALFEASQRNIWKKSPETVSNNTETETDATTSAGVESVKTTSTSRDIVDLTSDMPQTDFMARGEDGKNLREKAIVVGAETKEEETENFKEQSKGEVMEIVPDNAQVEGKEVEDEGEREEEGNVSSELVLKWDSESADESLTTQEPREKLTETKTTVKADGMGSGVTRISPELQEVDRNAVESDGELPSSEVPNVTSALGETAVGKICKDADTGICLQYKLDEEQSIDSSMSAEEKGTEADKGAGPSSEKEELDEMEDMETE